MKRIVLSTTCVIGAAAPLLGQEADTDIIKNPNRFNIGPRVGFKFKAEFSNHSQSDPGPATGGVNHNYDDGYVRVDAGGNAGGRTWNWGYQNSSQVVGGGIEFHSEQRSTVPLNTEAGSDDLQYGMELNYQRLVGTFFLAGYWGFEGAVSYTDLDLQDRRSTSGVMTHVTDLYSLNGSLPPTAPYNGSSAGPGTLLSDTPTRTTPTEAASTTSHQRLSGQVFGVRVGPFFEWNLTKQLGVSLSAGLTFAPTYVDYDFSETTTLQSGSVTSARGRSSKSDLLYGNYVTGNIRYDFTDHWGVYAGAQFQQLNDLEQTVAGRTARLDQGATFFGVAGLSWRF